MKSKIKNWIRESLGIEDNFSVELNDNVSFGNYFSNLALLVAKTDDQKKRS
jgi:hypothetical protein